MSDKNVFKDARDHRLATALKLVDREALRSQFEVFEKADQRIAAMPVMVGRIPVFSVTQKVVDDE